MGHGQWLRSRFRAALGFRRVAACLMLPAVALAASYFRSMYCLDSPSRAVLWYRWNTYACISDISSLFTARGMAFPAVPYRDYQFEYPVGTGAFAYLCAALTALLERFASIDQVLEYFSVSAALLALCGLATVWWVSRIPGARRGDVVFLSFGMVFTAFLNWDLLTVALTVAALYTWSRRCPNLCGVLLGWGAAAKAYPALLLLPLLLICLRERRLKVFVRTAVTALLAWMVFNLPFLSGSMRNGLTIFFTFNRNRKADYGSVWLLVERVLSVDWPADRLNLWSSVAFFVCALGVWVLGRYAPQTPQVGKLAFLTVAACLLTSKVWSPQYELWLLPLAVLTRLPWPALYSWLVTETAYFIAICWYYNGLAGITGPAINESTYLAALGVRWVVVAALCALTIRDILHPNRLRLLEQLVQ